MSERSWGTPEQLAKRAADEAAILARLTEAAAAGEPCPNNGELARLIGSAVSTHALDILTRLERRGVLAIDRRGKHRAVTIVATGQRTGDGGGRWPVSSPAPEGARAPPLTLDQLVASGAPLTREAVLAAGMVTSRRRYEAGRLSSVSLAEHERQVEGPPPGAGRPCFRCEARGPCAHRPEGTF